MILSCREDYYSELNQAVVVWSTIAGWILFSMTLYCVLLKERIEGAPGLGAQFFAVSGTIQIVIVIVGSILFFPPCWACYCPKFHAFLYLIPVIEGTVGAFCLRTAWNLGLRASQVSNDVFTKIPTETEMTEISETEGEHEEVEDGCSL